MYNQIENSYGEDLSHRIPSYLLLAKKWQDEDLIWPFSDLDFRVLLKNLPASWIELNEHIYDTHRTHVRSHPLNQRILEHPPGFIFLAREIEGGWGPAADIATWSLCHGPQKILHSFQMMSQATPWSPEDADYYYSLLRARLGVYDLANDSDDNIVGNRAYYALHCICWHYFMPVWFASAALTQRARLRGKTFALRQGCLHNDLCRHVLSIVQKNYVFSSQLMFRLSQAKGSPGLPETA